MGMFDFFHEWAHHLKVYMLNEYAGSYRVNKVFWKLQSDTSINYNKATYIINLKKAIFTSKNNPILYYEINKPEPLDITNGKTPVKGSATELKNVIHDNSTSSILNEGHERKMLIIVSLCVIVVLIVCGVAMYLINQQNKEIAELALKLAQTYANATKTGGGPVVIP